MKQLSEINFGKREIVVIYHMPCYDGFGAAYAAWKKFGSGATYIPGGYKEAPPVRPGSVVFVLDLAWKKEMCLQLAEMNEVIVIDHHDTSKEQFKDLDFAHFDGTQSGAMLAWKYFHPGQPVPRLIEYLQDRDLWDFKLASSKEVSAALESYPFDFDVWDDLMDRTVGLAIEGKTVLKHMDQIVENIAKKHWMINFEGYRVPVVVASSYFSEVGQKLLDLHPECEVAMFLIIGKDHISYSLRSRKGIGPHVGKIAEKYGGGGHPSAAAFGSQQPLSFIGASWAWR